MTLSPGDPAPDFTLPDQEGHEVSLSGLRGQNVVLYFYPKAERSGPISNRSLIRPAGH
jgi:peroxiredoxin Q/BCP